MTTRTTNMNGEAENLAIAIQNAKINTDQATEAVRNLTNGNRASMRALLKLVAGNLANRENYHDASSLLRDFGFKNWDTDLYNKAISYKIRENFHEEALDIAYQLPKEKWSARTFNTAALALSQLDKFEEVITLLKELSTENWDNFSFNICIKALIKLDRKPEALLLMFQLGEENWERNHLLMAVRTLNELEHYNRVIDLLKNRDLDSGLSKELAVATLGQYRERTTLQDTTDHKPEDINALGESMVAFNRQKLYEEALELAYSIDQTKWNTKIFNSAAISLNGLNRFEETVEILQTNPRSNWDNISYTLCATAFTRTNRPNDALLTLENVPPNQVTMHIRNCAVQAMIVLEQYEDGYTYMEEGGRQEWDAVSYNLAAIALDRMEKYEDALDLIRSMSNEMRDGMHYSLAKSIARKIGPEAMDAVRDTLAPIGHTPKAKVIEHIIDEQKGIAWKAMKEIFEKDSTMQFIPEQANRGGLTADINGIRTFLPASQLALAHTVRGTTLQDIERGLNALVGQNFSVKIISLNENRHNVVVSEIANTTILTNKSFEKLRVGDIRDGIVTSIVQYGLFVAFDNLEGLVHLSEISWSKIEDSSSAATIGDKIKVKVIGIKDDKISLSLKQLSENPLEKYEVNKIIKGRVRRFTNYGAFIEIEPGIMGLIHISELAVDRVSNPQDILKINQLVDTKIISLDKEKRRIGLSLKNLRQNTDSTIDDQETKIEEQGKPDIPKEEVNNLELPSTENLEIKNDEHYPEATSIITNPVTTINFEKYLIEIKSEISALRRSLLTLKIQKESDKDAYSTLIIELYEKLLKLLPEINQELYKEDINLICDQIELLANQYVKHVMGDEIYARLHVLKRFIQSIPASSRSSHTLSPDTIHENNEGILIVSAEESKPISIDINNPIPDLNLNEDEYPITESHTPALNGQEIESENTPQTINLHKDQATEIPTPIDTIAMPEKKELSRDELWPKAEECINNALMKCQKILKDSKKIDKEKVGNVTKYYFKVYKDIYIKYCPIFLKNPFEIEPLLNRWKETVYCSLHIYFTELKKVNNDLVQETLVEMQKFVNFICEEFVKIDPQANYEILKNIMASKITIKGVENIKSIDGKDFILELSNALSKVLLNIRELKKEKLIAEASNEVRSILQVAKDIYPDKPYFDFLDIKKIELVVSGTKFIAKKNGLKGDKLAGQEFAGMLQKATKPLFDEYLTLLSSQETTQSAEIEKPTQINEVEIDTVGNPDPTTINTTSNTSVIPTQQTDDTLEEERQLLTQYLLNLVSTYWLEYLQTVVKSQHASNIQDCADSIVIGFRLFGASLRACIDDLYSISPANGPAFNQFQQHIDRFTREARPIDWRLPMGTEAQFEEKVFARLRAEIALHTDANSFLSAGYLQQIALEDASAEIIKKLQDKKIKDAREIERKAVCADLKKYMKAINKKIIDLNTTIEMASDSKKADDALIEIRKLKDIFDGLLYDLFPADEL